MWKSCVHSASSPSFVCSSAFWRAGLALMTAAGKRRWRRKVVCLCMCMCVSICMCLCVRVSVCVSAWCYFTGNYYGHGNKKCYAPSAFGDSFFPSRTLLFRCLRICFTLSASTMYCSTWRRNTWQNNIRMCTTQ